MGIMTALVVGSGSWPAWMQRVAKSSRFDLVIQASRTAVIMRATEGSGKTRHGAAPKRSRACLVNAGCLCGHWRRKNSHRNPEIVDEVEAGCDAEEPVAVH